MLNRAVISDIHNRVWQATWQGDYHNALRIYDSELVPLNEPKVIGDMTNLGILYVLMSRFDKALEVFREARSLPSPPAIPVPFIGAILWMQGKHEDACADWAYEIKRRRSGEMTHSDEAGGVEVPVLLWWASAHTGLEEWRKLAEQELKRRWRAKRCQTSRWPGPLVPYLLGQTTDNAPSDDMLLNHVSAYSADYPRINFRYQCLAHFYLGTAYLAKGDTAEYQAHLKEVLAAKPFECCVGNAAYVGWSRRFETRRSRVSSGKSRTASE